MDLVTILPTHFIQYICTRNFVSHHLDNLYSCRVQIQLWKTVISAYLCRICDRGTTARLAQKVQSEYKHSVYQPRCFYKVIVFRFSFSFTSLSFSSLDRHSVTCSCSCTCRPFQSVWKRLLKILGAVWKNSPLRRVSRVPTLPNHTAAQCGHPRHSPEETDIQLCPKDFQQLLRLPNLWGLLANEPSLQTIL